MDVISDDPKKEQLIKKIEKSEVDDEASFDVVYKKVKPIIEPVVMQRFVTEVFRTDDDFAAKYKKYY
jgi:hypothetical protein